MTKKYYITHKKEINKKTLEYYYNHRIKINKQRKEYYLKNKDKIIKKNEDYQKENKEKILIYQDEYRINHKDELKEQKDKWYLKNRKRLLIKAKEYKKTHRKERRIYSKSKYDTDINFKILCNLRTRLNLALKGNPKLETTMNLVGCSIEDLKFHLEKQFISDMSWSNYGSWHVDHIRPCASFDMSNPEEQAKCFHYSNLQPLWAIDNLQKSDKL